MPNTVTPVRPNATVSAGDWTAGGTLHGDTSDNSDGSFITTSTPVPCVLDLTTVTIPARAIIRAVTVRVRASVAFSFAAVDLIDPATGAARNVGSVSPTSTPTTYTLGTLTTTPSGGAWTQAAISALRIRLTAPTLAPRVYEVYVDVVYNQAPTVNVTGPSGTIIDTSRPDFIHTYSDPEGDGQERIWRKVFEQAVYTAPDFDAATSPAAWNPGPVVSSSTSQQIGVDLDNGTTYKAYAKASDVGSSGRYGDWDAGPAFTMATDPPNVPVVIAPTADVDDAWIVFGLRAYENILSDNQASLETDTTGWRPGTNAGIARLTAQSLDGVASLAMTATAGGNMLADTGNALVPVTPGEVWSAVASFRAAVTGRDCRVDIRWRDADGNSLLVSQGVIVTDKTTGWVQSYCVSTADPDAAFGEVNLTVLAAAAGEVHYVDQIALRPSNVNLLSLNQASVETDLTGWQAGANATVARRQDPAHVFHGLNSLAVSAVASGTMAGRTPTGTSGLPARESQQYTAMFQTRAVSTGRSVNVLVRFYDSAGAQIGVDADSTSPNTPNSAGAWTAVSYTVTSPAGTRFLSIHLQVVAAGTAGETHVFDQISVSEGGSTTWQPGQVPWSRGGLSTKKVELQRSDDGGATWHPIRVTLGVVTAPTADPFPLNATQYATVIRDHAAPDGVQLLYRARSAATFAGSALTGPWSYPMPAILNLAEPQLKDPFDVSRDMAIPGLQMPFQYSPRSQATVTDTLGAELPIPRSDGPKGDEGAAVIETEGNVAHAQLDTLIRSGRTLLLQVPVLGQWYLAITSKPSTTVLTADDIDTVFRSTSFSWVEVAAP